MVEKVKRGETTKHGQPVTRPQGPPRSRRRTTRVSRKNQVTVPVAELRAAGLEAGDMVQVEALGAGRVILTRIDELIERYAGALDTGGEFARQSRALRDEWQA